MYNNQIHPCMMCNQMPQYNNTQNNMMDVEDKDLEMMYPKVYFKLMPMVKGHCDKLEGKYGMYFCPSKEEMEDIIEDICEKFEKDIDDEDDEKEKKGKKDKCREDSFDYQSDDNKRRPRYGRRRVLRDLVGIVLLDELLGRRRRRRPHYGYGPSYGWW
jgi:hypothetical protein